MLSKVNSWFFQTAKTHQIVTVLCVNWCFVKKAKNKKSVKRDVQESRPGLKHPKSLTGF